MDGEIVEYNSSLNRGSIIGEDKRNYGFSTADWHSAGQPLHGEAVRFVAENERATQIYRQPPPYVPPLTGGEAIEAVYRTAFSKGGVDADLFGGATVRWQSFILPTVLVLVLNELEVVFRGQLPVSLGDVTFLVAMLVLAIVAIGLLLSVLLAAGAVALLGRMMAPRGRIAVGVLGYIWAQAVLVGPAIALVRVSLQPRDPTLAMLALGVLLIVVVIGAGRVQKSAFQLNSVGGGIFMVLAAGIVTSLVDLILSGQ